MEHLGDAAGLYTRVRQCTLAAREGLEGRVLGMDEMAHHTGQRAFAIWPDLATRPGLQEEFRGVSERPNRRTALRALETWIAKVQQTGHTALRKCVETVRRWEQEILTSFDERSTHGFVEGLHNQIKRIKRRAFGFRTCENVRYRILHECGGL